MTALDDKSAAWEALGSATTQAAAVRSPGKKVLVAGVGNKLRADDAFGVEVANRLMAMDLPEGVKVVETGIGGIALVQELQAEMADGRRKRLVKLGFPPERAASLSALHTRNFM